MIGVISDTHFKETLGYADYFEDGRRGEFQIMLDTVVDAFKDCHTIVLNGDSLDKRHNPSGVIQQFVAFLERFEDKEIYVLGGNHEKLGNGKSALDFLAEIKNKPNWHVIVKEVKNVMIGGKVVTFCPYFHRTEVGSEEDEYGVQHLMEQLKGGDILFVHHTISDTFTVQETSTNLFKEAVLPKATLESRYKLVIGGHIHKPADYGATSVVGCSFNNELGDRDKRALIVHEDDLVTQTVSLPGRNIYKVQDPFSNTELEEWSKKADSDPRHIVKVILTEDRGSDTIERIKSVFRKFETFIFLEKYSKNRKKSTKVNEEVFELTPEKLLEVYSKERGVDLDKLQRGWALINS